MNASEIRTIAQGISQDRADATAQADSLTVALINASLDTDTSGLVAQIIAAERRVDELAEAESHAWDAYSDANEAEHLDYLATQDA